MTEFMKAIIFGIVEGITEWLPVSSTGHMILLNEFLTLHVSAEFWDMFLVVIQLGAILAVIVLFWNQIWPFALARGADPGGRAVSGTARGHAAGGGFVRGGRAVSGKRPENVAVGPVEVRMDVMINWLKVVVSCLPAVVFVILGLDDVCDELFYHPVCVAAALIIFGIAFLIVENRNAGRRAVAEEMWDITFGMAALIGVFQLLAAAFPGTSRSGATIIGALLIGVSRRAASEFTFILAIPVMLGASLLEMLDFGFALTGEEWMILLFGMASAFLVSVLVIRFLLGYIRRHDFRVFGWYRIALGLVVLGYFYFL